MSERGASRRFVWSIVTAQMLVADVPVTLSADYLGAAYLTVGEVIHLDYSAYRNITRWLSNMKARPSWSQVNEGFYAYFVAPFKDTAFVGLEGAALA